MQKIKTFIEEKSAYMIRGLLAIILLLSLIIVGFMYKDYGEQEEDLENQLLEELFIEEELNEESVMVTEEASLSEIDQEIIIDVKGAVEAPGVYEMQADSRVIDCVEKAGGFLIDAEQKSVNLAQKAVDQMVIYIPTKGEDVAVIEQLLPDKPLGESVRSDNKIDLNKATKEELKSLSGIGDTKAESIIAYREKNGSFQKVEDIKNVSGIGEATFEKLCETIQVTP